MKIVRCLGVLIFALISMHAAAQLTALNGALGANFNGEYENVNYGDLSQAHDQWVRGFLPVTKVDSRNAAGQPAITASLEAESRGLHTILTLKWPFQKSTIPEQGSPEYIAVLAQLDSVLPLVMGKVDILEIGNEPYWETKPAERDQRLNRFYEAMAHRVIAYRKAHCGPTCRTHLFMGALNRLNIPEVRQSSWVKEWMAFVRETPEIDGVDIHPHVNSLDASRPFITFVISEMRPDQKFLATEFSLVWYWKEHLSDTVPAAFARQYGFPATMKMWQAIGRATDSPFTQQEWNDLLTQSPWFASQSHYLDDQMALFRSTHRLAVATYGFEQGASMTHGFGPQSVPWLLNPVYARRTVRSGKDGSAPTNPYWLASFRRLAQP